MYTKDYKFVTIQNKCIMIGFSPQGEGLGCGMGTT